MSPDERADVLAASCTARSHGTRRAYTYSGCRCPEALDAVSARDRSRRPTGTRTGRRSRDPNPDLVAVERAVGGDRTVYLTVLELGLAIADLGRRGYSAKATARRLGVSDRTVTRHRAGLVLSARGLVHRLSRDSSTAVSDSADERDAA